MGRRDIDTCETAALDNLGDRIDAEGSREFFFHYMKICIFPLCTVVFSELGIVC
jgi:hypothetical protein